MEQDVKLYINEVAVDLPRGFAKQLKVTKGGLDVSDLENRSADHSYTLTLPFTRVNDGLFNGRRIHHRTGKFFFTEPLRARLVACGRDFLQGTFRLQSIKGGYEGRITSDEIDIFTQLGDKTLREITTFAPWHYRGKYDFPQILSVTADTSDVCMPLVAYGNFFAPSAQRDENGLEIDIPPSNRIVAGLEVDDYPPSVFFVSIIKNIFASHGWRAIGEPLEDPFFKELALPYTGDGYGFNWAELGRLEVEAPQVDHVAGLIRSGVLESGVWTQWSYYPIAMPATYDPCNFYSTGNNTDYGMGAHPFYRVRVPGVYKVSIEAVPESLSIEYANNPSAIMWEKVELQVLRKVNGGTDFAAGKEALDKSEVACSVPLVQGTAAAKAEGYVICEAGDVLVPLYKNSYAFQDNGSNAPVDFLDALLTGFVFTVTPDVEVGPVAVDIAANLPEWNQRDFVKAFLTMGALRFTTDYSRKCITFSYPQRYFLPADHAVDLSGYADPAASDFSPATSAGRFIFSFTEDSGSATPAGFGSLSVETGNTNSEGPAEITLPFAPALMREYRTDYEELGNHVFTLPCLCSKSDLGVPLNQVDWSFSHTPALVRYKGPSAGRVWLAFINRGFDESGQLHQFGAADTAGLNWQELYGRFYNGYAGQVAKGEILKNEFAITADVYAQLHPARPVLFHGVLYRLNKLQGFPIADPTAKAEIELFPVAMEAYGGGKPANTDANTGKEFYGKEFYSKEWY